MQVVADEIEGIAPILDLLCRAIDFVTHPTVIAEQRHQRKEDDARQQKPHHQFDQREAALRDRYAHFADAAFERAHVAVLSVEITMRIKTARRRGSLAAP
jgi:hypothetical protein